MAEGVHILVNRLVAGSLAGSRSTDYAKQSQMCRGHLARDPKAKRLRHELYQLCETKPICREQAGGARELHGRLCETKPIRTDRIDPKSCTEKELCSLFQ
jgi:hypothetical protein